MGLRRARPSQTYTNSAQLGGSLQRAQSAQEATLDAPRLDQEREASRHGARRARPCPRLRRGGLRGAATPILFPI
eukprot:3810206-Alexandrium_andersonii.AAC.1